MNRFVAVRSSPPTLIAVTSMRAQSSAVRARSPSDEARARSRMNVERLSFHAFQYRWNCSSVAATVVMFRQVMVSEPVIVRVAGSSRAVMV